MIIGGTLLTGGRGTLIGSILGVLVFTTITNLFILNNLATEVQNIAKGADHRRRRAVPAAAPGRVRRHLSRQPATTAPAPAATMPDPLDPVHARSDRRGACPSSGAPLVAGAGAGAGARRARSNDPPHAAATAPTRRRRAGRAPQPGRQVTIGFSAPAADHGWIAAIAANAKAQAAKYRT